MLRPQAPQAFTFFRGVGFIAWRLGRPNKGDADEAEGIFGNARRVWAFPCDRTHVKTALCHICPVLGRMINDRGRFTKRSGARSQSEALKAESYMSWLHSTYLP